MRPLARSRRLSVTLALAVGGLVLAALAGWHLGERRALELQAAHASRQLELHVQALAQRIERYRALPRLLALDPGLRAGVEGPVDDATRLALNRRLETINRSAGAGTLTLIDRDGVAVAASNWRDADSNVGEDFGFRPYVQQALRAGSGRFYGIGVVTRVPGYFLSDAIRGADGRTVGLVSMKVSLTPVERSWPATGDVVLVSDAHGVAFLASRPQWRYRVLAPLDATARAELAATRQYHDQPLRPYHGQPLDRAGTADPRMRIETPSMPGTWLWKNAPVADTGWRLHLLQDAAPIAAGARRGALAAGIGWIAFVLLALVVQQRLRLSALRRRSRAELETLVRHHAEELRSARDGLVAAAQEADTGLSRRLAHLPQGVVIIDADLRIVAWNARYIELFRFPPDLVQVGTPIEAVFRYNASRGLLGPGPVEEAIERRLDHLRSGKPHMRESEKSDGTVLEIRGNPLPDGGFVTSYADITSYKTTARELRTLADALERRIAERTADLEQARAQAEAANRYKGRFVAAAVHDLLQPLNAARMFTTGLRVRLHDGDTRRLADHIDGALSAQDGILASLLDLSRLETGTLRTDVRDVPLGPLLESLARETGVLAQARGLRFDHVSTRVWVRSDATLLRRLVQNFLSNAVRYTARGRIGLGVRRDGNCVWIEVHDTGPGIPPNRQREIFEEFRRLDDGGPGDRGAGLGLTIVERIARLLGHRIDLRSHPGTGSVFRVSVPIASPQAPVVSSAPPASIADDDAPLRGCRVWVVDDDPQACAATRLLLERWQCDVLFTGGPHAALAAAAHGAAPDLVMLGVLPMGEPPGQSLLDTLCDRWGAVPLVIVVTGEPEPALRTQALDAGYGFLRKPLRPPALRALMMQMRLRGR